MTVGDIMSDTFRYQQAKWSVAHIICRNDTRSGCWRHRRARTKSRHSAAFEPPPACSLTTSTGGGFAVRRRGRTRPHPTARGHRPSSIGVIRQRGSEFDHGVAVCPERLDLRRGAALPAHLECEPWTCPTVIRRRGRATIGCCSVQVPLPVWHDWRRLCRPSTNWRPKHGRST
jgi:hypothetical protein